MSLRRDSPELLKLLRSEFENRWTKFRRVLFRENQVVFDDMMKATKVHKAAIDAMPNGSDFEKMVMAIMIEQSKLNNALESQVKMLKQKIESTEKGS